MTKRDYQAIARAIFEATADRCGVGDCDAIIVKLSGDVDGCPVHGIGRVREYHSAAVKDRLLANMIDVLAADSPRFNRELFLEACETGKCKGMKGDKK